MVVLCGGYCVGGWLVVGGWCNANAGNVDSDLNYFSFPGVWDSLLPCMISLVWTELDRTMAELDRTMAGLDRIMARLERIRGELDMI